MARIDLEDDRTIRTLLHDLFDAAVASADPVKTLGQHVPDPPRGRCIVVGAGKASPAMAAALEAAWPDVSLSGLVVTRDGHSVTTRRIEIVEASHPVPDHRSEQAARRMLSLVTGLTPDDMVIALMSGGGSATLAMPAPGIAFDDKVALHQALLHSGATIGEMNLVRGAVSAIKSGRLARAAFPAKVVTLVISDVPGDRPDMIASGPTVGRPPPRADALAIIRHYGIKIPPTIAAFLGQPDLRVDQVNALDDVRMIASPTLMLQAASGFARQVGIPTLTLGDALEGEAAEMGTVLASISKSVVQHGLPAKAPLIVLSGGEGTVTIRDGRVGRGGRNTEFLLGLALALQGERRVWAIAGDTDGIDGTEDAAGAIVTPDTLVRAYAANLDPRGMLAGHDSYSLFATLGDLVITGPTYTNVNDFRAILIA
ncbi:glycerate kinase type-2 family protein [Sphingomonas sp. PAMC 26621]|uniref:glycerate kinase type-2 family protein n=1 Tax=Sphingomonas sp. PAMC 26621 TaxID=1112213 RepID=UPI0002881554|nr:glycerate kinase [Sphingomonas sp. PAMC 26621]